MGFGRYPNASGGGSGITALTGGVTASGSGSVAATVVTNANLTGVITSSGNATSIASQTGTGTKFVVDTSPTLVTPLLGIPTSGTLTNCTGLPVGSGISGFGTGVATFLATPSSANLASAITDETGSGALVFATSPTLVTPLLGTPTSGVLTNCTGTAAGLTAGNVTTNANLTGGVTSVGNAATVITNANLTGGVTSVGNAATVITNANLTGDVTSVGNVTTIAPLTINAQSGTTYTFVLTDAGKVVTGSNAGATTYTVPTNASVAFSVGQQIVISQVGAGKITLAAAGGVTINSVSSNLSLSAQYAGATLLKTATNTWLLIGSLAA